MPVKKPTNTSKKARKATKGPRAEGQTTITIPMPIELRDELRAMAQADDREMAPYIRRKLTVLADRSAREFANSTAGREARIFKNDL